MNMIDYPIYTLNTKSRSIF